MKYLSCPVFPRSCLLFALLALGGCAPKTPPVKTVIDGFAQGGTYHVVVLDKQLREELRGPIDSLLAVIDRSMSLYNPASLLSRLNRGETDTLDAFIAACIRKADVLSRESGGRYDITVKPLIAAYGFGAEGPTQQPNVDSLMQFVGYEKIAVESNRLVRKHPGVQIDLNSIAQGASADWVAGWLDNQGLKNYLVEIGGEIYARGRNAQGEPWTVGVDRPVEGNFIPGADLQVRIGISDRGLATSGNYRKYYTDSLGRKIVHTVDARTGLPVTGTLLSATVVAPDATLADAYGTLCMILGLEQSIDFLKAKPELEAYLVWADGTGAFRSYMTSGMEAMIVP